MRGARSIPTVGLAAILLTAIACDSGAPVAQPNLTSIQSFVFDKSCAFSGCHSQASQAGGLDLSSAAASYAALVGAPTRDGTRVRVDPTHPENSYLLNKLTGVDIAPSTVSMPPIGDKVSDANIDVIAAWIQGGCAP